MSTMDGKAAFWQPHLGVFWAYVAFVVFGVASIISGYCLSAAATPMMALLGAVAAAVLGVLLWLLIRWLDFYQARQATSLLAAFVWGGFAATAIAITTNGHIESITSKLGGDAVATQWSAALAGPTSEEWLKTAGVVAIVLIARRLVTRPMHGLLIGAMSGLGFQLFEDFTYTVNGALEHPDSDLTGAGSVTAMRFGLGLGSHWMYSAIAGLGIVYFLTRKDAGMRRRLLAGIGGPALAWTLHFLWNSPLPTGDTEAGGLAVVLLVLKVASTLVVFFLVYRRVMRSEWAWFAGSMAGFASAADLEIMRTRKRRRRARKAARKHWGKPAGKLVARIQHAQVRLAVAVDARDHHAVARCRAELHALTVRLNQYARQSWCAGTGFDS